MRRFIPLWGILLIMIASLAACSSGIGAKLSPTQVETDACCLNKPSLLEETLEPAQSHTETPAPGIPVKQPNEPTIPVKQPADTPGGKLIRQGASFSSLDPYQVEDVAAGDYRIEHPICGETYFLNLPEESGEIVLTLRYTTPLLPEQIEIFTTGQTKGIKQIEMLNSTTGLGKLIYEGGSPIRSEALTEGACTELLILSAAVDFEVDTLFITFKNRVAAAQVGAVEMLGRLEGYVEVPVFWRVPLPGTPIDIAAGQNGLIYAAVEPNNLYAYDIEGNQLKQFSVPSEARLTGVAADPFGNLILTDAVYNWFFILSPEGEQLTMGGGNKYFQAAVSPLDGNLYLLKYSNIDVYTSDTAELIRQIPLDDAHSYIRLAFDPQGRLYILRDPDWSSALLALDPLTGEELDTIPLNRFDQGVIVARDFAIDASGNFIILFQMNTGAIAVHVLDPRGSLLKRFGKLSSDPDGWPEGAFLDPRSLSITPDGRFILVADGYGETSFLTAFLVETE